MGQVLVDFDAPDLAARVEQLSDAERDALPFGVIHLDRDGTVLFYSATEARLSGNPNSPKGQNFYALSRCMGGDNFRGRIARALEEGAVDLEIAWPGDYGDPNRELRIRVQSAHDGGVWLCIERDPTPAAAQPCAKQTKSQA
jgi:photoactive yellow protein